MRFNWLFRLASFAALLAPAAFASEQTTARALDGSAVSAAYVPVVASTTGMGGSRFVSYLSVTNPHSFPMTVTAYVLPGGVDNRGFRATARPITLPANGGIRINDPLASLWGTGGLGTLYLESVPGPGNDGAFIADSRLLNVANPNATYGLSVPPTLSGIRSTDRGYAADIESDVQYRTNIGLFNDSSAVAAVRVEIVADDGSLIGSRTYSLPPFALVQDAVTNVTSSSFSHAAVRVIPPPGLSGQIIGYVAVADNATSDAAVALIQPYTPLAGAALSIRVEMSRYRFAPGSPDGPPITLRAENEYELVFHSAEGTHGVTPIPQLGIAGSPSIAAGSDYVVRVTPTADQRGARFNFACTHFCGIGHGGMYGVITIE